MAGDEENDRVSNVRQRLLGSDARGAVVGVDPYILSRLKVGDVWWVASSIAYIDQKPMRPWIIVRGYSPRHAGIVISPRTTQLNGRHRGLVMPSGVPIGMNKEGLLLLRVRRTISVNAFQDCNYVNRLSNRWIERIRQFLEDCIEGGP